MGYCWISNDVCRFNGDCKSKKCILSQVDRDNDGKGNACDECDLVGDSDGDGIDDCEDNCPEDANADQKDSDGDGEAFGGDVCDDCPNDGGDSDGDGFTSCEDNCPNVFNSGQDDEDNDGIGDECDTSECGNGVSEEGEECDGEDFCTKDCKVEQQGDPCDYLDAEFDWTIGSCSLQDFCGEGMRCINEHIDNENLDCHRCEIESKKEYFIKVYPVGNDPSEPTPLESLGKGFTKIEPEF